MRTYHGDTTSFDKILVPSHSGIDASGKSTGEISKSHTQRRIFKTEPIEVQARDRPGIADASTKNINTCREVDFFRKSELSDEFLSFLYCICPVASCSDIGCWWRSAWSAEERSGVCGNGTRHPAYAVDRAIDGMLDTHERERREVREGLRW